MIVIWRDKENGGFGRSVTGDSSADRITCYGFDTIRDVEDRLKYKNESDNMVLECRISESSWPRYRTNLMGKKEEIKYLCQLSKEKSVVLSVEQLYWSEAGAVMYGCPTARIFKDSDKQKHCSVEIVRYE